MKEIVNHFPAVRKMVQDLKEPVDVDLTTLIRRKPDQIIIQKPEQKKIMSEAELIVLVCAAFCFGVFTGITLATESFKHGSIFASDWKSALLIPVFIFLAGIVLYAVKERK